MEHSQIIEIISDKSLVAVHIVDHERGDILVYRNNGKYCVAVEMHDIGGSTWEPCGEFLDLSIAMESVAETITINAQNDFYQE